MARRNLAAMTLAGLLALGSTVGLAACGDDEDGDGGVTDEEIQEGEDKAEDLGDDAEDVVDDVGDEVDDLEDEVDQEVDAQDEGSNEDGE